MGGCLVPPSFFHLHNIKTNQNGKANGSTDADEDAVMAGDADEDALMEDMRSSATQCREFSRPPIVSVYCITGKNLEKVIVAIDNIFAPLPAQDKVEVAPLPVQEKVEE
jgi:hypothetical protein